MSVEVFMVANPKGGSGKSTLATNLAGLLAHRDGVRGEVRVMLGDVDRQQSSRLWLERRPRALPRIRSWEIVVGEPARPPKGTTHVVIDTPAGLHGDKLKELVKLASRVLVPVQPSVFDMLATRRFLDDLAELKAARGMPIAVVAIRVHERTRSAEELRRFLETTSLPLLTFLRDTQNYVQLAAHGMTLYDLAAAKVEKDLAQWGPIEEWVFGK
jgi:chromosome partitioning protein